MAKFTKIKVTYQRALLGTVAVTSAGYATFSSTQQVTLGAGVSASIITGVDENDVLTEEAISVIPANTGVLLAGEAGTYDIYDATDLTAPTITTNYLVAVTDAEINAPVGSYILQQQNGITAFYPVRTRGDAQVGAGKAYLDLGGRSLAKRIFFNAEDMEAAGIATIPTGKVGGVKSVYTLSGTKVKDLQRGVNIVRLLDGSVIKKVK